MRNAERGEVGSRNSEVGTRNRRILGIDPGVHRTGYAVIDAGPCRVLDAGVIRTNAAASLAERLREIDDALTEVLDEHRADLLAVEDLYTHYAHPRTATLMGHARGVVLLAAARRGIAVESIPATTVKKTVTGSGRAGKTQIQRAIAATLGLSTPPEPPDVADALAVALCAALTVGAARSPRPAARRFVAQASRL